MFSPVSRKHLLGDLDALVCLFDPCDEPEVLYRHSRDWLRHMRKHAQRWRCSAKSHGIQKFGSREEFENHMKESHRKHYTNAQLDLLAERGTRSSGQLFEVCPLCGGKDSAEDGVISGSLIDHIVGHLRSLALKSLPPHYEDNDNDSSNSHDDESVKSRSTIRNILDDDNISLHSLHFPDVQRHDSPGRDAGDWDFLHKVIIHEVIPEPQEEDDDDEPIKASRGRLTSTLSTKKESTETDPILAENNEYDDDYNDIDINPGGDEIQSIIPTYEGFRQHILRLNPLIPETSTFLIDRIATHCVVRLKRLKDARTNHLDLVIKGSCPSRTLCLAMGGETLRLGVRGTLQWSDDDSSIDGPIKPRDFPRGIPMPPAASLPAELECHLCFRHKKLYKPSDWTKHVHEDLMPFTCTWESCREPKMFKRKADWVRHENEAHRHLEWWSCDVDDCRHICYRRDNFLKHLVREHRFPEPTLSQAIGTRRRDPTWMALEQCHVETQSNPSTEPCRFCGKTFTAWKRLTIHLAKHMEYISLPILKLVEESENKATKLEADPTPQNFDSLQISAEQEHRAYSNTLRDALGAEPPGVPLPGLGGAGWVEPSGAPLPSLDDMGLRHAREALPSLDHIGLRDHLKLPVRPASQLTQRDLPMVDHFVQSVLPDIFPIQQLSRQGQSISHLILTALQTNESYLHCCLMVASYHYKTTMKIESESVDTNVLQHHSALVKGIRELLNRKEDYEQVLQTTLSLITFQCHVGIYDSSIIRVPFYEHIRGTTSVAHALELPGLVSNSKQPEGFDRLYISMIAWVDILSSTMKGSPPYFARIYRERYLSRDNNDLGLVNLIGCEDHVMYLISEIACLDALKKEGIDDDTVRQHITVLEEQLDDVKMRESAPEIFINGSLNLRQLTHYITEAFLTAAKLYLQSLSPGFYTQRLDCMGKVERITELLHNIPPGPKGYDRSLVWVYLVCGSVSMPSSSFRPFFNDRVAQLGDAAKLGSFGGLVSVLQEIWHPTAPGDPSSTERSLHPRWRHAMMRKGWDYLLI
ncbi:hypothetical protein F4776DRAFT_653618 [Hypoxylon sp. NC0597]|nr:hypothetical protein F4776DRAFT_653618 [Hypoxylon sp. NC0597]